MPKNDRNGCLMTESDCATDKMIARISSLLTSYLSFFPEERNFLQRLSAQLDDQDRLIYSRKNMRGHLTASAILLDRERQSIFLVYHRFLKLWLQPGGHLDLCEDPIQGAFREFIEETGIKQVELHAWHAVNSIALDMDTHFIPVNESKGEGEHYHHDFQYLFSIDGAESDAVVTIAEQEVSHFRWVPLTEMRTGDFDPRLKRVAQKIERLIL